MAYFNVPARPARSTQAVNVFMGVDFTNEPGNVDIRQSPYAENMIRSVPGKMEKSIGWHTVKRIGDAKVYGSYKRATDNDRLYHVGNKIYYGNTVVYSDAGEQPSSAYQLGDNLVIIDGKKLLIWNGTEIKAAQDMAYVPLLTIAKAPSGGGADYEALNLLSPKFKEQFIGIANEKKYQLSFGNLTGIDLVEIRNKDGEWEATTGYTVDLENGTVTFASAPGEPPVDGEDNVRIVAVREFEGYLDRVNKCTFGILYGVSGAADRLFLCGNDKYPNYDWYSGQNDATYFPDTGYGTVGNAASAIKGYSMIGNYLAAHKEETDPENAVVIREGILVDNEPAFPITNRIQGEGALTWRTFGYLASEPLFLTKQGAFAITTSDISGERYSNRRSYYLNGRLLEENGLENAFAVVHNELYWLFVNGKAYILDGMQPIVTKNDPYSTRQYAGFYRTNVPAVSAWVDGDKLCFGTDNGRVCEFYTDRSNAMSYNDDGSAIYACYTTPDFSGKDFYKNKTFRYLAVKLSRFYKTSVDMFVNQSGVWYKIFENRPGARYWSFQHLQFSELNFAADGSTATLQTKTRVKRVDKASYKFENANVNEPFGLMEYAIEYEQKSYYKG
jgi:hypothetical protein